MNTDEQARYERAKRRVKDLKGFYSNLSSFLMVNAILFIIDLISGDGWWFYWVTIFWGIAIIIHAFQMFSPLGRFDKDWEERKIQELMDQETGGSKAKRSMPSEYFEDE